MFPRFVGIAGDTMNRDDVDWPGSVYYCGRGSSNGLAARFPLRKEAEKSIFVSAWRDLLLWLA